MLWQILSLSLVIIATRVLWRRLRYDLHKVPSPPGLPLLGHSLEFLYGEASRSIHSWLQKSLKQLGYPKLMRIDLMGLSWLVVSDLDFIKQVMMSKTASLPKFLENGGFVLPMIGNDPSAKCMLMTETPSPYVKAVRRVYTSAFQTQNLKIAIPKLNAVIDGLLKIIEDKRSEGSLEFQSLFVRLTMDAIGIVALDLNLGGLDGSRNILGPLQQAGYVARERFSNPLKSLYMKCFPNSEDAQRGQAIIDKTTLEWDKLTKEILEKDAPSGNEEPIWLTMRTLTDPDTDKPIPFNSLRAELATVVLGGLETTGHQLAWIFALLASHPRVVNQLLQELKEHKLYGEDFKEVTFEDLGRLTYLTAVIKEGMRIGYVSGVSFLRYIPEDMTILGYRIPKGTLLIAPGTRCLNTEEMWGDPQVFRPERWLTDEDMSQKYSMGFSVGPRDCPGQRLAMLEMRLTIIKLFTQYEFTLKGDIQELLKNTKDGLVTEAKDGVWLNVKRRSAAV